jgi:hypothetical protein
LNHRQVAPRVRDCGDLDGAASRASNKARLLATRQNARSQLLERIEKAGEINSDEVRSVSEFSHAHEREKRWWKYNCTLLSRLFNTDEYADEYRSARRPVYFADDRYTDPSWAEMNGRLVRSITSQISALHSIILGLIEEGATTVGSVESATQGGSNLELLIERFHRVARQMRVRHGSRTPLEINDEYDVQDLLHALLMIFFDDIRDEEWTPSYAGASSRMDYLLPGLGMAVEVKKSRQALIARVLGDELLVDIAKYQKHPQCRKLLCFVYDPDGLISNPRGIESDLSKRHDNLAVRVMIVPRHS